jgi:hypothetical protein
VRVSAAPLPPTCALAARFRLGYIVSLLAGMLAGCSSTTTGGARDLVPDGKPVTIDSKQPSAFDFEFF